APAGQEALAWLLAQGKDIIPSRESPSSSMYLTENIAAASLELSEQDFQAVRDVTVKADASQGDRYPPAFMAQLFVDTSAL
ncbi:hypothetical protein DFH07DRAFT_686788, partial [Mycena maculata]